MIHLYEYDKNEEFYARFIHVRGPDHSVLVFNYDEGARELAERVAGMLGDEWEWFEGSDVEFYDLEDS